MVSKVDRAKQFLPFAALNGLNEALKEKEIEYVDKIEVDGERLEDIEDKLKLIEKSKEVMITYYSNRQYKKIKGLITQFNPVMKKLAVNDTKINFVDIFNIELL